MAQNYGRLYYQSLKDHYKCIGANEIAVLRAEDYIKRFFTEEIKSHTCGGKNSRHASQ